MAETTRPPIRCCRCGVAITRRDDEEARVRVAVLFGAPMSILWKNDAPWRYIDLCMACAQALDAWIEAGPVKKEASSMRRKLRDRADNAPPAAGAWVYPLAGRRAKGR